MEYPEKLKDPRWQKRRLEIFERDKWTCVCCGRQDKTLHVHHLFYFPNTEPWEYKDEHLITYCEYCHNSEHLIGNQLDEILIDILKRNALLVKPVAQLSILCENYPPFRKSLRDFLNNEMMIYLATQKNQSTNDKTVLQP